MSMAPKDLDEQKKAIAAAKAEILAAIGSTNEKLEFGIKAQAVKSIQFLIVTVGPAKSQDEETNIVIAPVNPEKTVVLMHGESIPTGTSASTRIGLKELTSTNVALVFRGYYSDLQKLDIEVVEFY